MDFAEGNHIPMLSLIPFRQETMFCLLCSIGFQTGSDSALNMTLDMVQQLGVSELDKPAPAVEPIVEVNRGGADVGAHWGSANCRS